MSFNPNIPLVTDPLPQSFNQLRANFRQIAASFAENHVELTKSENSGKHRLLTIQPTNDPATDPDEIGVYSKIIGLNPPQLFYRPNLNGTPIQLTYDSINTDPTQTQQYSFIAGPFVIYGGKLEGVSTGNTITLLPATTLIHVDAVVITNGNINRTQIIPSNLAANSFDLYASFSSVVDIYYFAVGV